jgi:tRNA delta(2)-isopentenylpyrophosphate transferase
MRPPLQKVNEGNATIADQPPVLVFTGPPASGKSLLAILVAEAFGGEIVNADSLQVYREMAILTARPSPADEARIPLHLYGVPSVSEISSVGAWLNAAVPVIDDIRRRGRWPFVCGGTWPLSQDTT